MDKDWLAIGEAKDGHYVFRMDRKTLPQATVVSGPFPSAESAQKDADRRRCKSCGEIIDPDWCWCGDRIEDHGYGSGHSAVPMGCVCGYVTPPSRQS